MSSRSRTLAVLAMAFVLGLVVAACGSSGSATTDTTGAPPLTVPTGASGERGRRGDDEHDGELIDDIEPHELGRFHRVDRVGVREHRQYRVRLLRRRGRVRQHRQRQRRLGGDRRLEQLRRVRKRFRVGIWLWLRFREWLRQRRRRARVGVLPAEPRRLLVGPTGYGYEHPGPRPGVCTA